MLLAKAGEPGPYVLVGHSFGGLYAILYAHQYTGNVVGMVLVDSSHEDQVARDKALLTPEQARHHHDGLVQNEEGVDMDQVLAQVRAAHWRTNIPLYVLARGRVDPYPADWSAERIARREQAWREMQEDHTRRSSNGKLIIAEKSGHDIQDEQPELVIDAVRQVITRARDKAGQARLYLERRNLGWDSLPSSQTEPLRIRAGFSAVAMLAVVICEGISRETELPC